MAGEAIVMVPAKTDDVDIVLEILNQARAWLLERGIDQWRAGSLTRERFLEWISRGEVYLARVDGEYVGTVTLQWSDERFWGQRPPDAGYVHKLAIRPTQTGKRLGLLMLQWAEETTRAAGREYLRLDCAANDRKIRDYYEQAGFVYQGDKVDPRVAVSLYEKPL